MSDELMTDGVDAILAEARKTKETAERMANGDGPHSPSVSGPSWVCVLETTTCVIPGNCLRTFQVLALKKPIRPLLEPE